MTWTNDFNFPAKGKKSGAFIMVLNPPYEEYARHVVRHPNPADACTSPCSTKILCYLGLFAIGGLVE